MLNVATHSGTFHADDVFAYSILRAATGGALVLHRSRDAEIWNLADVVFDVGGIFDPAIRRYDHHMRDKPRRANGETYSSAGLVWNDCGRTALARLLPQARPSQIEGIWEKLDQGLIRDVDLMDNGEMVPNPGHFSALLERWNATFLETEADENAAFQQAAELASMVLARSAAHAYASVNARDAVAAAAAAGEDPRIIVLDSRLPWEDAVFDLILDQALYVVRPAGKDWTVSAVPPERGSFAQRLALPDPWGGLRDRELAALTGVADATFCHPARFVCGAASKAGAIALARLAVAAG